MGIDARMLLRVKGRPTENQLKVWSWSIAAALGAEHFFLRKEEGQGAISYTGARYSEEGDPIPGSVYRQDGDDIEAMAGETLLELHLWTRYYGIGYERGDLLILCAAAEWCEANIPDCEVWYGGDSSGVCAEPWPDKKRRALRAHLYSANGKDYARGWNGLGNEKSPNPRPAPCTLCVGQGDFNECGWGGKGGAPWLLMHCLGCGEDFETRNNGLTWAKPDEKKAA